MFRDGPTGSLYIGGFWKNSLGNVENTECLAKLPFGSTGPWEPVVETGGFPHGFVYTMFREDGPTGSLYIGGQWGNINGAENTANLAKLRYGSTGPWEAVSGSTNPNETVRTMFRDGPTGSLYIGGFWSNINGDDNTANLAKLPYGSTGPWEPVGSTTPNGTVHTMFRDELTGYLYIGGNFSNIGVANTQNLAKLPFGSTGPWEAISSTCPNDTVKIMFRDEPTGSLYIGGMWTNKLSGLENTQRLAQIKNETTNIIVNDTKYNIPKIGDTLEFVYANPWVKSKKK